MIVFADLFCGGVQKKSKRHRAEKVETPPCRKCWTAIIAQRVETPSLPKKLERQRRSQILAQGCFNPGNE
jgi:hypothetical protein